MDLQKYLLDELVPQVLRQAQDEVQARHDVVFQLHVEELLLPAPQALSLRAELGAAGFALFEGDGAVLSSGELRREYLIASPHQFGVGPHLADGRLFLPQALHQAAIKAPVVARSTTSHGRREEEEVAAQ